MKYSDYLICSDYDDTLYYHDLFARANIAAIEHFVENGGHFTLCTARLAQHVKPEDVPFPINAPMVSAAGAQIYDYTEKKHLKKLLLCAQWDETVEKALSFARDCTIVITYDGGALQFHESHPWEKEDAIAQIAGRSIYSVFGTKCDTSTISPIADIKAAFEGMADVVGAEDDWFTVYPIGVDKALGVREVKEMVGAKTLICVGDGLQDIPMLKEADIGVAVANAHEEVKTAADFVTCHAAEGAIVGVLKYIDALIEKKQ